MALIILIVLVAVLFGTAFITKRRFGVLGLGLSAGLVLSQSSSSNVAAFLQYIDVPVSPFQHSSAATILLLIAPSLVLTVAGPKYATMRSALVGSALYAAFAGAILVVPIATGLMVPDQTIMQLASSVARNVPLLTTIGICLAIIDMVQAQSSHGHDKKLKH